MKLLHCPLCKNRFIFVSSFSTYYCPLSPSHCIFQDDSEGNIMEIFFWIDINNQNYKIKLDYLNNLSNISYYINIHQIRYLDYNYLILDLNKQYNQEIITTRIKNILLLQ